MTNCIFCKIVSGELPSTKVYQDSEFVAFNDMNPKAPVHVLVVPRRHIASVNELGDADAGFVGRLVLVAKAIAGKLGVDPAYQLKVYVGKDAGQTVGHLHIHMLGGWSEPQA